jgi:hypothetical protein
MAEAVCTIFENHYHHGVAAMVNSLIKAGFSGNIYCGYRGSLPQWAQGCRTKSGIAALQVNEVATLVFIPCDSNVHLAHYKPTFMLRLLQNEAQDARQLHYLDPDIVLNCGWETMRRWSAGGIALSEDYYGYLPVRHPIRLGWKDWLSDYPELSVQSEFNQYFSSGYVGVSASDIEFLKLWETVIRRIGESGNYLQTLVTGNSEKLFYLPDQDAMNIALMCGKFTVNSAGPESMDFVPCGRMPKLLFHAIGSKKPWLGGFLRMALRGYAPTQSARQFFKHTAGPLKSFTRMQLWCLKTEFRLATQLSRLFKPTEYRFRNP